MTLNTKINYIANSKFSFEMFVLFGLILVYIGRVQEIFSFLTPFRIGLLFQILAIPVVLSLSKNGYARLVDTSIPEVKILVALFCFGLVSAFFSQFLRASVTFMFNSFFRNIMFFILIIGVLKTVDDIRRAVWCYIGAITILAIPALMNRSSGRWTSMDASYDANDLALLFVTTLPFVICLIPKAKGFSKVVLLLAVPVLLNAFVATGSRGGFLGLTAILVTLLFRSQLRPIKKVGIIIAIVLAVINFAPSSFQERITSIGVEDYNNTDNFGRINIWKRSLDLLAHNPLFGVGPGSFAIANGFAYSAEVGGAAWNMTAHNSFLLITVEMGLIGGWLYMAFLSKNLRSMRRIMMGEANTEQEQHIWFAKALEAALIGFLVSGFFLSFCYKPVSYFLVALGVVFSKIYSDISGSKGHKNIDKSNIALA